MTFIQLEVIETYEIEREITIKNTDAFQQKMDELLKVSSKHMILDLEKVKYLNNAVLRIIAHAAMNAQKNNKELVIAGIKPPISEIFEIVKFDTFMKLFSTREEAVAYFKYK